MDNKFDEMSSLFAFADDHEEVDCIPVPAARYEELVRAETEFITFVVFLYLCV